MKTRLRHGLATLLPWLLAGASTTATAADAPPPPPAWAYPQPPPARADPGDDGRLLRMPQSAVGDARGPLDDRFAVSDRHPEDHPPMPAIVAQGRRPEVAACGYCHRPDGAGGPEDARLAGLPYGYILQQLADFKSGARRSALPAGLPQAIMVAGARALTADEARAAAAYFSQLPPRRAVQVRETENVPGTEREPIGQRIIEVPEDREDFERRDARARFVAYVPTGSVARGASIVRGAAPGKSPSCATCHGPALRGQGNVPGIAGRSPSYVVRQLYDIRSGARAGQAVQVMRGLVARLDAEDMIAVAAYLAGLEP